METFVPSSSNIDRAEYEPQTRELTVTFKTGSTYRYRGVPRETFLGLQNARSAGSYLFANIRTNYPYEEI